MAEILYLSIVDVIKERILKGHYKPGDMLDSEAAMMKEFQASRMTIRKSLSLLSHEGYVYSVPGKGSFVCTPETYLFHFRFNKYEDMAVPIEEVKLLSVQVREADGLLRQKLALKLDEKILEVRRLLLSANQPVAMEFIFFAYIPNRPVVEERLKFANHLEGIERNFAFALEKYVTMRILPVDETVGRYLGVNGGEMALCLEEEVVNSENQSVFSYTRFFALPRYFVLKASSHLEEGSNAKKIF